MQGSARVIMTLFHISSELFFLSSETIVTIEEKTCHRGLSLLHDPYAHVTLHQDELCTAVKRSVPGRSGRQTWRRGCRWGSSRTVQHSSGRPAGLLVRRPRECIPGTQSCAPSRALVAAPRQQCPPQAPSLARTWARHTGLSCKVDFVADVQSPISEDI